MTVAARFLDSVWRRQTPKPGQYAFVSIKDWDTGSWDDFPVGPVPDPNDNPTGRMAIADGNEPNNNLYFCPNFFQRPRRQRVHATGGRWLYADLDEVDPDTLPPTLTPTLAWETSPARYQGMWLLDRHLSNRTLELLNRRLTYYTGADKGGWSLTKVLRVPGSISTKYAEPFTVRIVPTDRRVYGAHDLNALLRDVDASRPHASTDRPKAADIPARGPLLRRVRPKLPVRARQLLSTKSIVGSDDRSARLWELERLCIDSGLTPVQTLSLVKDTVWNKYKGQRRELDMLWREIEKVRVNRADATQVAKNATPKPRKRKASRDKTALLPNTLSIEAFMDRQWAPPTWLVEDVWQEGAYGYVAGEYKSYKTVALIDLMLSVASGTPFLDKHTVMQTGPVCYIHEEGRRGSIREHLWRSRIHKGLAGRTATADDDHRLRDNDTAVEFRPVLPCHITSMARVDLSDDDVRVAVSAHVESLRPKLVILETFYLMSGDTNESSEQEVRPILSFLKELSERYGCAVIVSHHFHKSKEDSRHANRVSGSGVWNKWYESSITAQRVGEDEDNTVELRYAHRDGQATRELVQFEWDDSEDGNLTITHVDASERVTLGLPDIPVTDAMVEWLTEQGRPVHMKAIAEHFGITVQAARRRANRAGLSIENGKVSVGQ